MASTEGHSPPRAGAVFVGRERELAELTAGLDDARSGRGGLILLAGEPGIGKTRLADEFTAIARDRGALVLWGRCWEAGGAPTFWPWVQAIRTYLRDVETDVVRRDMGAGTAEVARMIPEVAELLPDVQAAPTTDPEGARFRLFDSLATFLRNAAEPRPIVLIVDDLQSADTPSLLLLRFVASLLQDTRLLVVGLFRETELEENEQLAATVAELRRQPTARLVTLTGLEEPDVTRLIDRTMDVAPPASLITAVYAETEGNPLFVGELLRLLAQEGRLRPLDPGSRLSIPRSIRDVIGQRVGHLSPACIDLLQFASVIGQEFELEVVARLQERQAREVLDAVNEAVRARVLTEVPSVGIRLRFVHALIRETLYDDLPATRRVELHRRTGEVLEDAFGPEREAHLPELAHHFFSAIPAADPARAVEYARRAGDVAAARLAFEEAARLYRVAMRAMTFFPEPDEELRCELLLGIGDAQARSGDMPTSRDTFFEAAQLAKRLGRPDQLARAAIGYGGRFVWQRAGNDRRLVPLLEDALEAVGDQRSSVRVRVLARLACALRDQHHRERSNRLSQQALEIARELDDPQALIYALDGRFAAILWPENPQERLGLANEMAGLAEHAGDLESEFQAHHCRAISLLDLGEIRNVQIELDVMRRIADELRQPSQRWITTTVAYTLAEMGGRFAEAESLMADAMEFGPSAVLTDAEAFVAGHGYRINKERGRPDSAVDAVRQPAKSFTWYPFLRCALADALLDAGHEPEARSVYEEIAAADFSLLPRDNEWLFALSLLSPVSVALGDAPGAKVLYELQQPYAARHAYGHSEGQAGSVSRALGVLASFLGRIDVAEQHLVDALDMNERMGARPWVAYTQHDYATLFLSRDRPGDREAALELARKASDTCEDLGMVALGDKISRLLGRSGLSAPGERERVQTRKRIVIATFRREGEYWSIVFQGNAFRLRDSKGLRYLSFLLAAPGREIHAPELVSAVEGHLSRGVDSELAPEIGDAGEVLDNRAKVEYRKRLEELESELEEAEDWNDPERAAGLRRERDLLAHELASAVGLKGRDRRAASNAERARVNVTRAIRSALERINEQSPEIGHHLSKTVRTGTFCSYQPDPLANIAWSS